MPKKVNKSINSNTCNTIYKKFQIDEITYTIILNGDRSDGKYSLIEIEFLSDREQEIPLHRHTKEDIIIYVIEGDFLIQKGNETINTKPGMIMKLEKNIEHSYKKIGNNKGKLLIIFEPAGFENYFGDLNSLQSSSNLPIDNDLHFFNKDDDRIRLHLLEKTYGWAFSR